MKYSGDYKAKFNAAVTAIIQEQIKDRQLRIKRIDTLIKEYRAEVGEKPEDTQLERLTDYILMEELTDKSRDKVTNTEYPFLSERQFDRRYENEAKIEAADVKFQKPTRRKRATWEHIKVDQAAKIRNKERKEQYRKDTAPGQVETFHIDPEALGRYLDETYGAKMKYSR